MHQVEVPPTAAPPTEVVPLTPPKAVVRKRRIAWFLATVCAIPSLLLFVFGAPITAAILLAVPIAILPGLRLRWCALIAAIAIVALAVTKMPLIEYTKRTQALENKRRASGPSSFTQRDLASVWLVNIALATGGYLCGFPEVATETLVMAWPFGPDTVRFDDEFAMRSPRVRAAVRDMMNEASASGEERVDLGPKKIAWSRYDVSDSPRVGLALNELTLTAKGRKLKGEYSLDISGRVKIAYPASGELDLGPVRIYEGLFWVAQERGWMHTYEADWHWSINQGDPRLSDTKPEVSWLEKRLFPK